MRRALRLTVSFCTALLVLLAVAGCGGGRPTHTARPSPAPTPPPKSTLPATPPPVEPTKDDQPIGGEILVRVALHWERGAVEITSTEGMVLDDLDRAASDVKLLATEGVIASSLRRSGKVRARQTSGEPLVDESSRLAIESIVGGRLIVNGREIRGAVRITAREDSLFVVNELPLEDYLRGVVPREIGPRPVAELAAVEAQAVAARTYTVKRLGQYNSLPFDLFGDVQDQAYDGFGGEHAVADRAVRDTEGLVVADETALIETFYSSTCGGMRSDIAEMWPHRPSHPALRGGRDGSPGREWCRESRHFQWEEEWDGARLNSLFRKHAPALLDIPGVQGTLTDIRVLRRGPSGRAALIEWVTDRGSWTVPGDKNRWILRRPDGGILRSVFVELDVRKAGGRVVSVRAQGRGNGHGVGMCQVGALGRAKAGQGFREILQAYYPGTRLRRIEGGDLPPGRSGSS